jgi:hypothetical protein
MAVMIAPSKKSEKSHFLEKKGGSLLLEGVRKEEKQCVI